MNKIKHIFFSGILLLSLVSCKSKELEQNQTYYHEENNIIEENGLDRQYTLIEVEKLDPSVIYNFAPTIRIATQYEKIQNNTQIKNELACGYIFSSQEMKILFDNKNVQFSIIRCCFDRNGKLISKNPVKTLANIYEEIYEIKMEYDNSSNEMKYFYQNKIVDEFDLIDVPSQGIIGYFIDLIFENDENLPSITSLPQNVPQINYEIEGNVCKFEKI